MRNVKGQKKQAIQIIKDHPKADLAGAEAVALKESFMENIKTHGTSNAIYDLIMDAYYMGLAVGYRNGKKDGKKAASKNNGL